MSEYMERFLSLKCSGDVLNAVGSMHKPEKEITESMGIIKHLKSIVLLEKMKYSVIDLCAGNALTSILAIHMLPIKEVIAIDKKKRSGHYEKVKRFRYYEMDIKDCAYAISDTILIAVHPCKTADFIVDIFNDTPRAKHLIMMPCCNGDFKDFMLKNKGEKKMKEEIQYKIVDVEKDIVKIQITKQTHVRIKEEKPVILIEASNGIVLMSDANPDHWLGDDRFYLRGCDKDKDDDIISMQIHIFEKFKVAIEEYNNQNEKFKKALSNVSENFDKWNDDMNSAYDGFEETLKKVKTIQEFHQLKFNFLEKILTELPISAEYCLDCELNDSKCFDCKFKEKNGICEERKSKWYKIYELRNKLIDAINEVVY